MVGTASGCRDLSPEWAAGVSVCFLLSLSLFFFSYIQNEALCGSKWCIFQLLLWNCHFDGSRCSDNSHQINLSKTLNEHRVFKHSASARSAATVWGKTCSFRREERGGHMSAEARCEMERFFGFMWAKNCLQGGWVTLRWSSPHVRFRLYGFFLFTGQLKVRGFRFKSSSSWSKTTTTHQLVYGKETVTVSQITTNEVLQTGFSEQPTRPTSKHYLHEQKQAVPKQ